MLRHIAAALAGAAVLAGAPTAAQAQEDWRPPSPEMPGMPAMSELRGGWSASSSAWFRGVDRVSGSPLASVQPRGEPGSSAGRAGFIRFVVGTTPVATWTDRNGDGRADMVEVFRGGAVAFQVLDPDFDGKANVLRVYDGSGALAREERL